MKESWGSKYLAEFIGTYILCFFGLGAVFVAVYVGAFKDLLPVMWLWAFAVVLAVYVGATVSGAHYNPSVTIALAVWKGFPWKQVVPFIVSQTVGAFFAALTLWVLFQGFAAPFEAANHLVRGQFGSQLSAMVFTCYIPNPGIVGFTPEAYAKVPLMVGFLSECIGTALLVLMIFVLLEQRNALVPHISQFPLILGVGVFAIVAITAPLSMASLNGARDLGPRILAYFLGWGEMAIPGPRGEFLILSLAPIVGGVLGGFIYEKILLPLYPPANPPPG
ncbi:MAG TPA: aquaporin [Patescibacteria group bacterium]|nr:aquaporin [Patescibacteria group bacterium]